MRLFSRHQVSTEDRILVAFSGGADSLALLVLLSDLCGPEHIVALYVNHRLRDARELAQEEQLNRVNCAALQVPFMIERLEPNAVQHLARERGNGIEDAARTLRYRILEEKRRELHCAYIATAHTADDQSETILMRLLQGAGPYSLQGIAELHGSIVRPVLGLNRATIEEIVRSAGLRWATDSTNADTRYLRNGVRHTLIPAISNLFPGYREALQQVASRSTELVEVITPLVDQAIETAVYEHEDRVEIDIDRLREHGAPVRIVTERVVYHCWNLLNDSAGRRLPYRVVQTICEMLERHDDRQRIAYGGTEGVRLKNLFEWRKQRVVLAEGYVSAVYLPCTELDGVMELVVGPTLRGHVPMDERARIADETIASPLIVRSSRAGDTIELVGGRKLVSALFNEWHIERSQRWRIPVLEDRLGLCAVLGAAYGGKDRVATRCQLATLARNDGTLYSVSDREG